MTRVRDNSTVALHSYSVLETSGPNVVTNYTASHRVKSLSAMEDVATKGFKKKSSRGGLVFSPMTRTKQLPTLIPTSEFIQTATNRWASTLPTTWNNSQLLSADSTGTLIPWHPMSNPAVVDEVESVEELAITEAYARVQQPDVELLTELAELKETVGFLMSPLRAMTKLTDRMKSQLRRIAEVDRINKRNYEMWASKPAHRRRPTPPRVMKYPKFRVGRITGTDIASSWLAYRYGIMPLIYTFQDVEKLIKKRAENKNPTRATARKKVSEPVSVDWTSPSSTITYAGGHATWVWYKEGTVTVTARAGVMYEPEWSLLGQLGVQWNRVPKALYEIVPLSFVTDWFHNGIEVYDALTAEFRAHKILGAWVTTKADYAIVGGKKFTAISGCTVNPVAMSYEDHGFWQRRRNTSLSDVRFRIRVDMDGKRIADGLALIYNFLATVKKR